MNNAEKFKYVFGLYATELWAMSEESFLSWLNSEYEKERKKGKWIEQDDGWDGVYYECSECKEAFTLIDGTPTDNLYNFCPNCGADMRGE